MKDNNQNIRKKTTKKQLHQFLALWLFADMLLLLVGTNLFTENLFQSKNAHLGQIFLFSTLCILILVNNYFRTNKQASGLANN
jgi:hypothetical protein